MKFIAIFFRLILGASLTRLTQQLHIRLLNDWLMKPGVEYLYPQCTWKLADEHPCQGTYVGSDFYDWYINQLASTYWKWSQVINEVIGSSIGGIVVGEYYFQRVPNGSWYSAPFTHFYKIRQGQITDIRYFMGKVSLCEASRQVLDLPSLYQFCSPN